MAKGFLESEGIEVLIKDELTAQVNNFYSNAIGGVKLLVRTEDYDLGIETLINGGFIKTEDKENSIKIEDVPLTINTDKSYCPYCKSENIGRKSDPNILAVILYFILGVLFPIFRRSYICFDCTKEWKYAKTKLEKTTHNTR
jgi:DNA-directed RNA polymerase subunit RPC12/RpoP